VGDERVAAVNPAVVEEAWWGMGAPTTGGILIVGDHATNFVPPDIDLGIDPALLETHIASDIGVAAVARTLVEAGAADTAFLAGVSRLVIDLNREPNAPGLIPLTSDGHAIPGNALNDGGRTQRITRFYNPYHAKLAQIIAMARPGMILSLHSFTPSLASRPSEERPWHLGVLYNEDDRLAQVAIPALSALGPFVGDQLPYSGKDLNYTMNHHAEANGIPYLGVEMRQDLVADADSVWQIADHLAAALAECRNYLARAAVERLADDSFWNLE
jgi:predicted N-formylglutamate amidohydrolase